MEISRDIEAKLLQWKNRADRRPLIIRGARQVGKTWIMKQFGHRHYKHTAYFNFDSSSELKAEFENLRDPERIIGILRLYTSEEITPEDTLIIFDEVQECPNALNALKYFYELQPCYHIIAAGSLLGVALNRTGVFPVGKVEFVDMYPVSFREFLCADCPDVWKWLESWNCIDAIPGIIDSRARESFDRYRICGGMPQAATAMLAKAGNSEIAGIQKDILTAYRLDFAKHAPKNDVPRVDEILNSLPSQLAKENRKFIYKLVRPGARAREYENSLLWLVEAGIIYKVQCLSKPALPLSAYDDLSAFKIYMFDCGLLRQLALLPPEIFVSANPMFSEFKGAIAENIILQSLVPQLEAMPRYWVSDGRAEIDFIIQCGLNVIPVEVKAESNTAGKSLGVYTEKYKPTFAVIFSAQPFARKDNVLHIPLWLADFTTRIIDTALTHTCPPEGRL